MYAIKQFYEEIGEQVTVMLYAFFLILKILHIVSINHCERFFRKANRSTLQYILSFKDRHL